MMSAICFVTSEVRMRTESALSAVALRILLIGRGMPMLVSIQALTGLVVLQRSTAGGMLGTQESRKFTP